jgi:glycosyltransferase involved in cell wall biosynthesis
MKHNKPLVSACIITYNHEEFIEEALKGAISQKINYPYEIVIGNDKSTDNTAQICHKYQDQHPELIHLIDNEQNLGIVGNWVSTFKKSRGKYIAICEGDDYWTDSQKLQHQIDFLEENPQYSACAHQSLVIYEDGNKEPHTFNKQNTDRDLETKDLIGLRKFHSASFVFRSDILHKSPAFPENITAADRALFILCASHGPIRYMKEPMCIYRKNETGITSWITPKLMKRDLNAVPWIMKTNPSFPKNRYRTYIHKTIIEYPDRVAFFPLVKHYFLHIWYSFSYFPENRHEMKASFRIFIKQLKKNFKNP